MKKRISLMSFVLAAFMLFGMVACKINVTPPSVTGDRTSFVINEIWEDENGEKWVNMSVNNMNSIIKDARTIIPDNPDLYFSVVASTDAWPASSNTTKSTATLESSFHAKIDGDANCSTAVAGVDGKLVVNPYYATETNKMTGITLTLKVGKSYYFTAYATNESPSAISVANFASVDVTGDTVYTQGYKNGALTQNTPANFYANRADLVQHMANLAVVKGTAQFFIDDEDGDIAIYSGADNTGTKTQAIKINTSATDISGYGYALVPVNLDATTTLDSKHLQVEKIRFKWNQKDGTAAGQLDVDVAGAAMDIAIFPMISVGEYDTDLILLDESDNDIFTIHDTMTIWKNQVSVLLGKSSYYVQDVATWTKAFIGDALPTGTPPVEGASPSTSKTTPTLITAGMANGITGPVIGYRITADNIEKYFRSIFYVSGSGAVLPVESDATKQDGSLFHPFDTVQKAVDAITLAASTYSRANGYGDDTTDWNIVIDGAPTTAGDVAYDNTTDTTFNLTIRRFATARVSLANNVTFTNATTDNDATPFNIWLTNVDWDGSGKTFTAGANILLTNSALASDITAPAAGAGDVVLYKDSATIQDGVFYALTTDDSTVMNISNKDDADKAVIKDADVLRYDYFTPNASYTTSPAVTYMTLDVLDEDNAFATPRFALAPAFVTGDALCTAVAITAGTPEIERVLRIDEQTDSENFGCVIIQAKVNTVAVGFEQGALRVFIDSWTPSPATWTAAQVAADTAEVTITLKVTSEDSANYPSNDASVLGVLKKLGDDTGTLTTLVEADQGAVATEDTHYTVTYPSATGTYTDNGDGTDECTYIMKVKLKTFFANAVGYVSATDDFINAPDEAAFRLYIKSTLGGSDFQNAIELKVTK